MSSINPNQVIPTVPTDRTYTGNAQGAHTAQGPHAAVSADAAPMAAVPTDGYAKTGTAAAASDVTKTPPPIVSESKPADYQQHLQGAQQNLSAFQASSAVSPAEVQLLAAENQANNKVGYKASAEADSRKQVQTNQADSIVASAQESHKKGCGTHFDNQKENIQKMQALGFTKRQAQTMTRTLEDKNVPAAVKNKLAYQLAAMGMTGKGGPLAGSSVAQNAAEIKKNLGSFADAQRTALRDAYEGKTSQDHDRGRQFMHRFDRQDVENAMKDSGTRLDRAIGGVKPILPDQDITIPTTSGLSAATQNTADIQAMTLNAAVHNLK